jgi:hypothetical protein
MGVAAPMLSHAEYKADGREQSLSAHGADEDVGDLGPGGAFGAGCEDRDPLISQHKFRL